MALPRKLWAKAPLVLFQHRAVLLAVVATSFLVALAAASAPLLQAGAESEALQSELTQLSPLSAGLTISTGPTVGKHPVAADRRRRAAAARLARSLPFVGSAILTSSAYAGVEGKLASLAAPPTVVLMARTNAMAHVERLAGGGSDAYLASSIANLLHVRPGASLQLVGGFPSPATRVEVRVGAIYRSLDSDLTNPYWVNFTVRIRARNPDAPQPPTFLLLRTADLYRLVRRLGLPGLSNTYELPIAGHTMTPGRAKEIAREFAGVRRQLGRPTPLARSLGCVERCSVTSSLTDAVVLARKSTDALRPVISVLAAFVVLISLGAAFVAGAFSARRRAAEARLSVIGGESRLVFGARAALEAVLPALAGGAGGFACAAGLVRLFTPSGTVDHGVFRSALGASALAAAVGVTALAAGSWAARGPTIEKPERRLRLGLVPWELVVAAGAVAAFVAIERGGGLVKNQVAGAHPRLVVLCFPLLVAAALAGTVLRIVRPALRRARPGGDAAYLALRRLAAARALLVLLTVTAAICFSALTFAEVLGHSLTAGSVTKAHVANGSDVQGLVEASQSAPSQFPVPIAKVTEAFNAAQLDDGTSVELLAVDPRQLSTVIDSAALRKLAASDAPLPVIATGAASHAQWLLTGERRLRVQVVASVRSFPGMIAAEPLVVVPEAKLVQKSPSALLNANAYFWARGDPTVIQRAFGRITPQPVYVTTVRYFLQSADLSTAARTYGFLRVIALGAAAVALVALLLYLHARARAQRVTGAFLRRMGMRATSQALSSALEAAALVAFAALVGAGSALLAARPLVTRVDPLPQYAPAATVSVPWTLVVVSFAVIVVLAAIAGAAVSAFAGRGDVGEALRVA